MTNILPFKKPAYIGNIMISIKYDVLEDGSVWYSFMWKDVWSEWRKVDEE